MLAHCREQFTPVVRKRHLYGRGWTDMKAGVAAMNYAANLLKELKVPLRGRIGLCLLADEEAGGRSRASTGTRSDD
jgi:acetylornithine deacetylase/succinyl-diaminopimelate desuccinylase-like protein